MELDNKYFIISANYGLMKLYELKEDFTKLEEL